MKKDSVEVDGKRYVTTKVMAGFWGVSQRTVSRYCHDGLVIGAFKDSSNRYLIPAGARKPLGKNVIEKVLWLVIQLKNTPSFEIDYSTTEIKPGHLASAFKYLADLMLVTEPGDYPTEEIPYRVRLTQKGMDFIKEKKGPDKDWKAAINLILQLLPSLVSLVVYVLSL